MVTPCQDLMDAPLVPAALDAVDPHPGPGGQRQRACRDPRVGRQGGRHREGPFRSLGPVDAVIEGEIDQQAGGAFPHRRQFVHQEVLVMGARPPGDPPERVARLVGPEARRLIVREGACPVGAGSFRQATRVGRPGQREHVRVDDQLQGGEDLPLLAVQAEPVAGRQAADRPPRRVPAVPTA